MDRADRIAQGVERYRAGDLAGAEALYREVLAEDGGDVDAHQLLGLALHRGGRHADALWHLDRALAGDAELGPVWSNRAQVLIALERLEEAEESAARAVQLRPDLAEARILLMRLRLARGALVEAADAAEPIRDRLPVELVGGLGSALVAAGEPARGAVWLGDAIRREPTQARWIAWVDALLMAPDPPLDQGDLLERALEREGLDHQRLDRAIRATLADDPAVRRWLDGEGVALEHPLLVPWLRRVIVQSPRWEWRLAALRDQAEALPLLEALALQAWYTGYAWEGSGATDEPSPDDAPAVARWALYADPTALGDGAWTKALPHLAAATLHTARQEAEEAARIELIGLTPDAVSAAVRAQYEEDPYPRLFSVHQGEPAPVGEALGRLGIDLALPERVQVLVAGCGTGQHPIQSALAWAGAELLAVDLSRRSLARARLRARKLGLEGRITFAQADILALDGLDRVFHIVESVGVLHHLADPLAGWRILRDRTAPGGLMRIGLYSERGRSQVVAARQVVEQAGLGTSPADLRRARQLLADLPSDHPAASIVRSPDFYSLSGLRDLVFHACEHRFTLPQLGELLDALDLRFLGFQHTRADALPRFRARFSDPRDLGAWDLLEAEDPDLFGGLYVFWCQRA